MSPLRIFAFSVSEIVFHFFWPNAARNFASNSSPFSEVRCPLSRLKVTSFSPPSFFSKSLRRLSNLTSPEIRAARAKAIYSEDEGLSIGKSHENPYIAQIYREFLVDGPCSKKSYELLHTHYTNRGNAIV
ncbi:MAG: iron hydrogenase small subunit [Deltaproteobacteria bacterium]|nr:iron hydrogenase small subunit [Deltaproteobacteria bacterium]